MDQPKDNAQYLRQWAADIRTNSGSSMDADRLDAIAAEIEFLRNECMRIAREGSDRINAAAVALNYLDDAITGLHRDTPIEVLNEIPRLARTGVIHALAHARKLTGRCADLPQ
jgi:hypothetical protein